jgi:STE24 endopeptidase
MSVEGLFFIIIAIVVCEFGLTKYLGYLNTKNWSDTLPDAAKDIYNKEKYQKSQKYEKAKYSF